MKNIAFVFSGQGAQSVGMGKDFYEQYPEARKVFDRAATVLPFDVRELCFNGPQEALTKTRVCQPAICTVSYAIYRVVSAQHPQPPKAAAGLSLGEYTAITAAGCLSFEDALTLVAARAEFMTEACAMNPGAMVSVLGEDLEKVKSVCQKTGAEVANINSATQVVVAGSPAAIKAFSEAAKIAGIRKLIPLKVEGAFHSSAMKPAAQKLARTLDSYTLRDAVLPVYCNVNPVATRDSSTIKRNLIAQVDGATHWHDTIVNMHRDGIEAFVEIGPGKVLSGLIAKILKDPCVYTIATVEDYTRVAEALYGAA